MRFIRFFVGFLIIGIFGIYLFQNPEYLSRLKDLSPEFLVILLSINLGVACLMSFQFGYIAKLFGLKLTFLECLGLTSVNTMMNQYFPANSGLLLRGVYLKKKYGYPLSSYAAMTVSSQLLSLLLLGWFALFALVFSLQYFYSYAYWYVYSLPVLSISLIFLFIFLAFSGRKFVGRMPFLRPRHLSLWDNFVKGLSRWRAHPRALIGFFLFVFLLYCLRSARLFFCFLALGNENITFWEVGFIQILVSASLIVSITPGNLGIREGLILFVSHLVDLDMGEALIAGLLDRAAAMFTFLIMGSVFSQFLWRKAA